jgi:integrase
VPLRNFVARGLADPRLGYATPAGAQLPIGPPPPYEYAVADFRGGQGQVPTLPALFVGNFLARLRTRPLTLLEKVVEQALSAGVRQRHRKALEDAAATLAANPAWGGASLEAFLIRMLVEKARLRHWLPQSTFREACNISGAFSNLPLYTNATHPVFLRNSAEWRAAMASWELASQQSQPTRQVSATLRDIEDALDQEPREAARVALLVMWLTAARPGCTLQLRTGDVEMKPDGSTTVHFRSGKGVKFRGPYTVHTEVPEHYRSEMRSFLDAATRGDLLFPATGEVPLNKRMPALLNALRQARPELNLRAMRRGALQTMALAGVDAETLMEFSGHTNVMTLKRYLDWGRLHGQAAAAGQAAARLLAGRR